MHAAFQHAAGAAKARRPAASRCSSRAAQQGVGCCCPSSSYCQPWVVSLLPVLLRGVMLAAAPPSPSRKEQYEASLEKYRTTLNQAKLNYATHKAQEDHAISKGQAPAVDGGPVLNFMESVITELICSRGCRHAIDAIERVRHQIDTTLRELKAANAAGDRVEMRRIVSLRQSFIVLNTTTVVQDGGRRWEFGATPTRRANGVKRSPRTSLPDIGSPAPIAHDDGQRQDKEAAETTSRSRAAAASGGGREAHEVAKALRHRLKRAEASAAAGQRRYAELEDKWQRTQERLDRREEALAASKARLTTATREVQQLQGALGEREQELRGAEAQGRVEAAAELGQKRRANAAAEKTIVSLRKSTGKLKAEVAVLRGRLEKSEAGVAEAEEVKRRQWQAVRRFKGALADSKALLQAVQDSGSPEDLPACVLSSYRCLHH